MSKATITFATPDGVELRFDLTMTAGEWKRVLADAETAQIKTSGSLRYLIATIDNMVKHSIGAMNKVQKADAWRVDKAPE